MTRTQRRFWPTFAACAFALVLGMAWVTHHVLTLEDAERRARCASDHHGTLRLGLWRVDSWMTAQLAPEAARPYFEYRAYYPQQKAYTKILGEIEPGEVLTPSPLLTFRSEVFPLHFQLGALSGLGSPQVPTGNQRDLAEAGLVSGADLDAMQARLEAVRPLLRVDALAARLEQVAAQPMHCTVVAEDGKGVEVAQYLEPDLKSRAYTANIARNALVQSESWVKLADERIAPGPMLPIWLDGAGDGESRLCFVRRVALPTEVVYQGVLVDWPRLTSIVLEQIEDLFPRGAARIARAENPDPERQQRMFATLPAMLEVEAPTPEVPGWSTTRSVLVTTWILLAVAVCAVGALLASALAFGEKRARFASAVTHELRSPLTTFRLYSEMLASGMVTDEVRRREYVQTLDRESTRLSRVVENVLAYARIEDGRHRSRREEITLAALVEHVTPGLEQRASDSGFVLEIAVGDPEAVADADADAVEQVLFGLVDNACKYAASARDRRIELHARAAGADLEIAIRDHGPGIPAEHQKSVFRAFERGARGAGESEIPGVGLGLALASRLASDFGGELVLDGGVRAGARFVLRVPRAGSRSARRSRRRARG